MGARTKEEEGGERDRDRWRNRERERERTMREGRKGEATSRWRAGGVHEEEEDEEERHGPPDRRMRRLRRQPAVRPQQQARLQRRRHRRPGGVQGTVGGLGAAGVGVHECRRPSLSLPLAHTHTLSLSLSFSLPLSLSVSHCVGTLSLSRSILEAGSRGEGRGDSRRSGGIGLERRGPGCMGGKDGEGKGSELMEGGGEERGKEGGKWREGAACWK